tara:strand:+ start:435 stop:725 length:291 start_codon:yes stop_codon:yes gene_type:complete
MAYYKLVTAPVGAEGQMRFETSEFLSLLTEAEMLSFFSNSTQIIADTAVLMSKRAGIVDVRSTRFDDVMSACVTEGIFSDERVAEFKRGTTTDFFT